MKCKKLIIFILIFLQFRIFADNNEFIQADVQNICGINEVLFFFYPNLPNIDVEGLNQIVIETLKKTGKVILKKFDIQNPLNLHKQPSMFYYLEELKDIDEISLNIFEAKIVVKTHAILKINKEYTESNIWERSCFVKNSNIKNYNELVKKSLNNLLNNYIKDLNSLDKKKYNNIVFYYAQ